MTETPISAETLFNECLRHLSYRPEVGQREALTELCHFVIDSRPGKTFILNGFAGTGKTSLLASLIKAMSAFRLKTVTLAPTGRAAKVASAFSGSPASTIHRRIYRPVDSGPSGEGWILAPNRSSHTLFIVDEASMLTDTRDSRSLLQHLIRYVYSAPGCAIVFVGDIAQLPPVGHTDSPAMEKRRLCELGLFPSYISLSHPMRQATGSGILWNATNIRKALFSSTKNIFRLVATPFEDVSLVEPEEMADTLSASWSEVGMEETIVITRSNRRANRINGEIRVRILGAEEPVTRGERLIISKNDYFWYPKNQKKGFIANGESAEVLWVGKMEKAYGRWFVDTELKFSDSEQPLATKIMLRSLMADGPAIPKEEQQRFFTTVLSSYEGEYSEKLKATDEDPFYNALQVKYAYCVTCHKAQGGQWRHVYIDLSAIDPQSIGPEFYRWLYTAVTRASEKLFLVNPSFPVA